MLKICKSCEKEIFNDEKICPNCGQSDFIVIDLEDESNTSQQTEDISGQTESDYRKVHEKPESHNVKDNYVEQTNSYIKNTYKKTGDSKKTLIITLVIVVINLLVLIGSFVSKQDSEDTNSSLNSVKENYSESSESDGGSSEVIIPYSKGEFDGTVYKNEWADIMFTMPEGFSNGAQDDYDSASDWKTDCGLFCQADDGTSFLQISFEKLSTSTYYDEEKYFDNIKVETNDFDDYIGDGVVDVICSDNYYVESIGGYIYKDLLINVDYGYGYWPAHFFARKLDDYMIVIMVIGMDDEAVDSIIKEIEPYWLF